VKQVATDPHSTGVQPFNYATPDATEQHMVQAAIDHLASGGQPIDYATYAAHEAAQQILKAAIDHFCSGATAVEPASGAHPFNYAMHNSVDDVPPVIPPVTLPDAVEPHMPQLPMGPLSPDTYAFHAVAHTDWYFW
jgi:hypothetical protein